MYKITLGFITPWGIERQKYFIDGSNLDAWLRKVDRLNPAIKIIERVPLWIS